MDTLLQFFSEILKNVNAQCVIQVEYGIPYVWGIKI